MPRIKARKSWLGERLGLIHWPRCERHADTRWEVFVDKMLPVVKIRTLAGNTFTYPGLDSERVVQLVLILMRFIRKRGVWNKFVVRVKAEFGVVIPRE